MRQILVKLSVLAIFLSLLSVSTSYADGPKIWIENEGGLKRDQLTNGKVKVSQSFFGSYDLSELVKDNSTALLHVERQSQYNTYAHLSYWFGVIPSAGVLGYELGTSNTTATIISVASLLGTAFLTGYFVSESRHSMYEAINIYNGVKKLDFAPISEVSKTPYTPNWASNAVGINFSF